MSTKAKKEPGMLMLVAVLAIISLVMAALLGMVNKVTEPAIKANEEKKTQSAMERVLPADAYTPVEYEGSDIRINAINQAGTEGYVVLVTPTSGFSGAIKMMAGISNDGTVTGIAIITHAETSGLGANATDPTWQAQFAGQSGEVKVSKDGGSIQSITGSTITSRAVCDGVNAALTAVAELG